MQARLGDDTSEAIADTLAESRCESTDRTEALRTCVGQLKESEFELVQRRYDSDENVDEIAGHSGHTIPSA